MWLYGRRAINLPMQMYGVYSGQSHAGVVMAGCDRKSSVIASNYSEGLRA